MDRARRSHPAAGVSLSSLLQALDDGGGDGRVSVAELVGHFGTRAFGGVMFVFSLLNLLPSPPGTSTILGAPLLILSPQLAFAASTPWLPGFITRRTLDRARLNRACRRAAPWMLRVEQMTRPRLGFMFGPLGDLMIGAVCTVLALVLVLPIPLGNMLPAASIAVLSLSLVQRDGALALIGYLLAAISFGVLVLSGEAVLFAVRRLAALLGAA